MGPSLLEGVTVLEVGNGVPVGYCGRVLRSLGADVLRIERASDPDPVRGFGVPCPAHAPLSCAYCHLNGSKARVLIPEADDAASAGLLAQLLHVADVLVVGDGELATRLTGWLRDGSLAAPDTVCIVGSPEEPALPADESAGVAAGLRDPYGEATPPDGQRLDVAEVNAGLHAAGVAALSLVRTARDTSPPALVEVGVHEAAFSIIEIAAQTLLLAEQFEASFPNMVSSPLAAPYLAADRQLLVINAYGKDIWQRLCSAMERPEMAGDERFQNQFLMYQYAADLRDLLDAWCADHDRAHLLQRLRAERVPTAPIVIPADLLNDPHVLARGILRDDGGVGHVGSGYLIDEQRFDLRHQTADDTERLLHALGLKMGRHTRPEVDPGAVILDVC